MWWRPERDGGEVAEGVRRLESQLIERGGDRGAVIAVGTVPIGQSFLPGIQWRPAVMVDVNASLLRSPLPIAVSYDLVAVDTPELRSWDVPPGTVAVLDARPVPLAGWEHSSSPRRIRGGGRGGRCGVAGLVLSDDDGLERVVTVGHLFDQGRQVEHATDAGWRSWGSADWFELPLDVSPNAGWDLATVVVDETAGLARPARLFDPVQHTWDRGLGVRVTTPDRDVDGETRPVGGIGPFAEEGVVTGVWTIGGDPPYRWKNCWTFATSMSHLVRGDSGSLALTNSGEALGLLVGGSAITPNPILITMWIQDLRTAVAESSRPSPLRAAGPLQRPSRSIF